MLTAGTALILNPFEAALDKNESVKWFSNGEVTNSFYRAPMLAQVLHPMKMLNEVEYERYCETVGHNSRFQLTTTIAQGGYCGPASAQQQSLDTLKSTTGTAEVQTITIVQVSAYCLMCYFELSYNITLILHWTQSLTFTRPALLEAIIFHSEVKSHHC